MNRKTIIGIACFVLFLGNVARSQTIWEGYGHLFVPSEQYVVYRTDAPVLLDGKADEPDWQRAEWTADFVDIEGENKPRPLYRTRMKMLWDTGNLYLYAELEEPDIWAYYKEHDQIIFQENDIEVFIDPDGDTHNYFEFEVNAQNTLFDLFLPKPYRNGSRPLVTWNASGFESAVSIDGTLNNPTDTDTKWGVEMKIPFSDLRTDEQVEVPVDGQIWRINFSRVEWRTELVDGKYRKAKNPATDRNYPEYNWVWSPPGLINMHYPERWGMLQFSDRQVGAEVVAFQLPTDTELKNYLWLVYYRQQDFKMKKGRFAANMQELGLPLEIPAENNAGYKISMQSTDLQFTIMAKTTDGAVYRLNDTGLFQKIDK